MSEFDFPSLFRKDVVRRFVAAQIEFIQEMISDASVFRSDAENAIVVRFSQEEHDLALSMWELSHMIDRPGSLALLSIKIESGEVLGVIPPITMVDEKQVNTAASPMTATEATAMVDRLGSESETPAAITFFASVNKSELGLYMNGYLKKFTGESIERLYKEDVLRLFRKAEAIRSLNELEERLETEGKVEDFKLISERSNGDYGEYTVDAFYVDWSGLPARLTIYKSFSPLPVPRH